MRVLVIEDDRKGAALVQPESDAVDFEQVSVHVGHERAAICSCL